MGDPMEVYLDHESSPKVPKEIAEVVYEYLTEKGYGNPSVPYKPGLEAFEVLYNLQEVLNDLLFDGIAIYLPGGSEANNLIIRSGIKGKIVVSSVEHESIIYTARRFGRKVVEVPVDNYGHIRLDELSEALDKEVNLVSVQLVNQELGSINDIKAVIDTLEDKGVDALLHVDACDGFLRMDMPEVDAVTLSGAKIYAPRGSGVLFVKEDVDLPELIEGPSLLQEQWRGRINVASLAGMLKAIEIFKGDIWTDVKEKKDFLLKGLREVEGVYINSPDESIDTLSISIDGNVDAAISELSRRGVYISKVGGEFSYVLQAIGKDDYLTKNRLVFRIAPFTTWKEVKYALEQLSEVLPNAPKDNS